MISKVKISAYFLLGIAVWTVIFVLRKSNIIIPYINDYLTDLYSVPMFCYTIKIFVNTFINNKWRPDFNFILTSTLYIAISFELIYPQLSDLYTFDVIDIACYFSGGLIYYLILSERIKPFSYKNSHKLPH